MITNKEILEIILGKYITQDDLQLRNKCLKPHVYEALVNNGVPYGMYLKVCSEWSESRYGDTCYLKLGNTPYIRDTKLKLQFKEVLDNIKFEKGINNCDFGGFYNVDSKKSSLTERAAEEAEKYIKEIFDNKEYKEFIEYMEYFNKLSASDMRSAAYKTDDYIYELFSGKSMDEYKKLTCSNNGNETRAYLVFGIPFEIK